MGLSSIGIGTAILGLAALGAAAAIHGSPLPQLHALPESVPDWISRAVGVFLAAGAIGAAFNRLAALGLAALWTSACVLALIAAIDARDLLAFVPVAEDAVFAGFAIWRWDEARGWLVLRLLFGVMLLLFGVIHLLHRDLIGALIPAWIPWRMHWPWLTGSLSLIAGAACVIGRGAAIAASAIGVMYLSWLAIVHAPRLRAAPESLFEWIFALTALTLGGIAFAVAGRVPSRTEQSSTVTDVG